MDQQPPAPNEEDRSALKGAPLVRRIMAQQLRDILARREVPNYSLPYPSSSELHRQEVASAFRQAFEKALRENRLEDAADMLDL